MNYLKEYSEPNKICQFKGCNQIGEWRRQNTQYIDDRENWGCYCPEHQVYMDDYWKMMWQEYYGGII